MLRFDMCWPLVMVLHCASARVDSRMAHGARRQVVVRITSPADPLGNEALAKWHNPLLGLIDEPFLFPPVESKDGRWKPSESLRMRLAVPGGIGGSVRDDGMLWRSTIPFIRRIFFILSKGYA